MIIEIFIVYLMLWLTVHELRGWVRLAREFSVDEPMPESVKHIMLSERLFEKPYYNLIVFCSTLNGLDKTVLAFKDKIKTPMLFINDSELMYFLAEHVREKMRYYSIYKFVMNKFKKSDELMSSLILQHGFNTKEKLVKFVANEFNRYQTNRYSLKAW